ncbi:MAG: hypothetical protein ABEH59_02045 [Halobacteriales archaeon]
MSFLAAPNSDADPQLPTVSSYITEDLLPRIGSDAAHRPSGVFGRNTTIGVGTVALATALLLPDLTALFSALGSWFAMHGFVLMASLFWRRMTDQAAFAGLTIGLLAPIAVVAVTGARELPVLIRLMATAVTVGVTGVLTNGSG